MAWAQKFNFPITSWNPTASTVTSQSETGGTNVAVGDFLIIASAYVVAGDTNVTISDNLGNTFNPCYDASLFSATDANRGWKFFYSLVTVAGTCTLTATYANAVSNNGLFCVAYTGLGGYLGGAAPRRQAGLAAGTDAAVSNPYGINAQPYLAFGLIHDMSAANGARLTAGTGSTARITAQKSGNTADIILIEDENITSTGLITLTATQAQSGDDHYTHALFFYETPSATVQANDQVDAQRIVRRNKRGGGLVMGTNTREWL